MLYDEDPEDHIHIAPIYDAPRMSYGSDPVGGFGCLVALAIVAVVIGLGTTCPAEYQWIVDGFLAYGICSLVAYLPAWWRAIHN